MEEQKTNFEDEINPLELASVIYEGKFLILLFSIFFAICSATYALQLPNLYTSSAVLEISSKSQTETGGTSALGMALSASISLTEGPSGSSKGMALLTSKETTRSLIEKEDILSDLFEFKSYNPITKEVEYDSSLIDQETGLRKNPSYLVVHKALMSGLEVKYDKFTGFIRIAYTHRSPTFSNKILNLLVSEVNNEAREKDLKSTKESLDYLNQKFVETNIENIRVTISSLIESQLKKQMFAFINEDYLLSFIDPPFIPEEISSPNRRSIVLTGTIIGFFLSIIFVLGRYFFRKSSIK